ncbi:MAG TPA: UvrD-helicase domain-containing protein [Bacteroidota bacterium]|nr:UvrD-helicase domain-containing protein [Bacteroidota bacterium]
MSALLTNEDGIVLPSVTVTIASAGAGKTQALAQRYVQILLSEKIPHNELRNILAITFTNNAAAEMKQRILKLLKLAALGDMETLADLRRLIPNRPADLRAKASSLVDEIFNDYSDFHVKTVDSFMSTIFTSSSIEYGIHPDFEVQLNADRIFDKAFDLFSKEIREGAAQASIVGKIIEFIAENRKREDSFLWDVYGDLANQIKKIYRMVASYTKPLEIRNDDDKTSGLRDRVIAQAATVEALIDQSTLAMSHLFKVDLELIRAGDVGSLIDRKFRSSPVNKPKGKKETAASEQWLPKIEQEQLGLNELLEEWFLHYAQSYYRPYAQAYAMMQHTIGEVKKQSGQIFIDDVNKTLAEHLNVQAVPEIYFKIGETIYHYLIDEFQDTSQLQWRNLFPLIEESLSKGGSLFVVGDTKQSIYGFRDADWRIMKSLSEKNPFPSADHTTVALETNYRSCEEIVEFNKDMFHKIIPGQGYEEASKASGLSAFKQHAQQSGGYQGVVDVAVVQKLDEETPERTKLEAIVDDCLSRGYKYNEIAILTPNNKNVVEVSGWLNEKGIPIISHSTLDVRRRKSAGEFIALLRFLDTPVDDLSFATFILGDVFTRCAAGHRAGIVPGAIAEWIAEAKRNEVGPLYTGFRQRYTSVWDEYFEHLFNIVGYLPLYDLLSEAYKIFDVFGTSPDEEASLVKLLEAIKAFEKEGRNAIKDFLAYVDDESVEDVWKIDVPAGIDALSVMTVHKAKGMGFPVVIVLLYDHPARGKGYIVREDEDSVTILKANKDIAEKVKEVGALLEEEQFRDTVDMLNKLYVAFTRAEKEMYVVGVFKKEPKEPTKFLPSKKYGEPRAVASGPSKASTGQIVSAFHHRKRKPLPVQEYESIGSVEAKRGDLVHRVFSLVEFLDGDERAQLASAVERVIVDMSSGVGRTEILKAVSDFIAAPGVRDYFVRKEGRKILREQDLTNAQGSLYRADRIIVDPAGVTVMDFKTGGNEPEAEYIRQVRNYMEIIRDIYPDKTVRGVIAYVDLKNKKNIS